MTQIKATAATTAHIIRRIYSGPWYKKVLVWIATFFISVILFLGAVDCNFLYLFGKSPGFNEIKNPIVNEASIVYSADSVLMGKYFNENRTPVTYEQISPILIRTLISTEDERFYEHHGIDFTALFAAAKDMMRGNARGASTITQQLAKNLFRVRTEYSTGLCGKIPGVKLLIMKAKEWIVALKLESIYDKKEILTMYLNTVDFGSNSYGINTAARTFFGTTPAKLNYEQSATLVGLLKATSTYNPKRNPRNSTARRNQVLENAFNNNAIIINGRQATRAQLDSLKATPLIVENETPESSYDGPAPYFRQYLREYIDKLCDMGLIEGYDSENRLDLDVAGLQIYTTLDTRIQKHAEEAVATQMAKIQKNFDNHWGNSPRWRDARGAEMPDFIEGIARRTPYYAYLSRKYNDNQDSIWAILNTPHTVKVYSYEGPVEKELSTMDSIRYMVSFMHTGFVAMEPDTRHVKAWVGDINFDNWKYDKVTAGRQAGSTFKLFVYAEAMNQGLTPNDRRLDSYVSYPDTTADGKPTRWAPHNADGVCSGENYTLRTAFAKSINTIAVKVGMEVGIPNIIKTAHAMGIESPLKDIKSLSLGSCDINLLELTNSYCTVVDDGKYNMPILVTLIKDRDGKTIYKAKLTDKQAIPQTTATAMLDLLTAGMRGFGGTIGSLWSWIGPFARYTSFGGKTGTSNNHSDAWFIGTTPKMVGGAWVGGEYRCIHFRTGQLGQGSRTALPIYGDFMKRLLSDPAFQQRYLVSFDPTKNKIINLDVPEVVKDTIADSLQNSPDMIVTDAETGLESSTTLEKDSLFN